MRSYILFSSFLVLFATSAAAQLEIVKVESKRLEKQTSKVSEDFMLHIKIRNTSKDILYIQGVDPNWFMIEAFIRKGKGGVWTRMNTGVDRELRMIPVQPGQEIATVRREATEDIGKPMMLTMLTANSSRDKTGSRILLGEFEIPGLSGK